MAKNLPEVPVPAPIQELRQSMDRVRQMQASAGMVIDLARYDAETTDINREFLDGFFDTLPAQLSYTGNSQKHGIADRFEVVDPVHMRPTTTFGIFMHTGNIFDNLEAGYVIGERVANIPKFPMTELLIAGQSRMVDKSSEWLPSVPRVSTVKVAADSWERQREAGIDLLGTPHDSERLMGNFASRLGEFILQKNMRLDTPLVVSWCVGMQELSTRAGRHYYHKQEKRKGGLIGVDRQTRSIRSSDFEDFDVMTHLEYTVAAYGVGKAFDKIKAAREAKMPVHPATTVLDLPSDYRQIMEQGGLHAASPHKLS